SFYSEIGRPSIDPELMIRMLLVAYCYGIRSERRLCEEVELHLAYRWFSRLDLEDEVPDHSTFSVNRHGRFRESDIFRQIFEEVVKGCSSGKGRGFWGGCERYRGGCEPLPWGEAGGSGLVGARAANAGCC